jgi:uncharacterized protein (DUF2252 family)
MKISELKAQIREEILSTLSEVTVVDKNTKPEEVKDEDPNTVKSAIDTAKKTNKAVNIAEEEDNYDFDEKEPSKSDMKKDSVATTANKLQKLITKMKALAKEYKQAKESKDEAKVKKITDQLKTMTKEKKQLEKAL